MKQRYVGCRTERRRQRTRNAVRAQGKTRLSVFRSGQYIYAQLIDDQRHHTLASASSLEKQAENLPSRSNCEAAAWVGAQIAQRGLAAGVSCVVFDRGAYRYHGRVKALADAARSSGLSF
jgi:large subunit ribosomal protein L18